MREQAEREGREPDGDFDVVTTFFHNVPPEVTVEALRRGERSSARLDTEASMKYGAKQA